MKEILSSIETVFSTYSFAKEVLLVIIGALFGGICTVIINNGAMKRQSRFDMQYKILSEESANISDLYRDIEYLEIEITFGDMSTDAHCEEISKISSRLMKLNGRLRDKRRFARKYLSASIVEASAQCVAAFQGIFFVIGPGGISDIYIVPKLDSARAEELRDLELSMRRLNNEISESMEKLISPGIVAALKRKGRKLLMFIEECNAMRKISRSEK